MNLSFVQGLVLAGIIQGVVFSGIVFFSKKYKERCLKFLGALILTFTYSNIQYLLPEIGAISLGGMYIYLFLPVALLAPPLLYAYVRTYLLPHKELSMGEKAWFAPFIIFLILTLIFRIARITGYENDSFYSFFNLALNLQELLGLVLMIVLSSICFYKVNTFLKSNNLKRSSTIKQNLGWLKITLVLLFITTLLWGYAAISNIFFAGFNPVLFYGLWLGMSFLIYWLGYVGVYKLGILKERQQIHSYRQKNKTNKGGEVAKNPKLAMLHHLMVHERIFLNPNISLNAVAERLDLSPSHLSHVLNNELQTNFTNYINQYRVTEAKLLLKNPTFSKYTITAIGLESGFNSKSAFYRVFRELTGKTPAAFKKKDV